MKERDTYKDKHTGENKLPETFRITPFSTPDNFFNDQQAAILAQIKIEEADKVNPMVPPGYFESLERSIIGRIASENLKEMISDTGFSVPPDFFGNQENAITARIAESSLKAKVLNDGFSVPDGYFTEENQGIMAEIITGKWKQEMSEDGFVVPENYFSELSARIHTVALGQQEENKSKIIKLAKSSGWLNYISAAAVLFIVGIGSYFALQESKTVDQLNVAQKNIDLHEISDDELLDYLAQVSEGDELIHLTNFVEQKDADRETIDKDIDDAAIKDYLNYML